MLYLRTGSLGAGKTLNTLKEVSEISKKDNRPVFYFNIELTDEGEEFFGDNWKRITADDVQSWEDFPPGTIFFLDECHKVFPVRPPSQKAPKWVEALAEHRSKGIDFYLITQHHKDIDLFIRRRIEGFREYKRQHGFDRASYKEYQQPNFDEELWRQNPQKGSVEFPKDYYSYYTSSSLHTVKKKIPWFFFAFPLVILFIIGVIYYLFSMLASSSDDTTGSPPSSPPSSPAAPSPVAPASNDGYNPVIPDRIKTPQKSTLAGVPPFLLDSQKIYLTGQARVDIRFGGSFSNYLIVHADGESTPVTNKFFINTGGQILTVDDRCTHRIIYNDFQVYTRCLPEPQQDEREDDYNDNPTQTASSAVTPDYASFNPFSSSNE